MIMEASGIRWAFKLAPQLSGRETVEAMKEKHVTEQLLNIMPDELRLWVREEAKDWR